MIQHVYTYIYTHTYIPLSLNPFRPPPARSGASGGWKSLSLRAAATWRKNAAKGFETWEPELSCLDSECLQALKLPTATTV